ncbi:MAG: hypothetical protein F6K58_28205, partial [Symploca sp. SIO2E9]|nr:hypothetical protein [Symploca sp. SIO2E9]
MYDRRPTSKNRLLDLERELVARGRSNQQNHFIPNRIKKGKVSQHWFLDSLDEQGKAPPPIKTSSDRPLSMQYQRPAASNNRLLDLEQELRGKVGQIQPKHPRQLQTQTPKQPLKRPQLSFKAYVFDAGEPIVVGYREAQESNHLPPSHLPPLTNKLESKIATTLSDETQNSNQSFVSTATQPNGHRSTSEAIKPELNFHETFTAAPSGNNSHNKGFHSAFSDISKEMKYATSFDLGEVEIEIPFDEFDQEIDREHSSAKGHTTPTAKTLEERFDEFDRNISLGESSTKTEQPPPTTMQNLQWRTGNEERGTWVNQKKSGGTSKQTRRRGDAETRRIEIPTEISLARGAPNRSLSITSTETLKENTGSAIKAIALAEPIINEQQGTVKAWEQNLDQSPTNPILEMGDSTLKEEVESRAGNRSLLTVPRFLFPIPLLVETLPSSSLVWQGSNPILSPLDLGLNFKPMLPLQWFSRILITSLPVIVRLLVDTLLFLAALSQIFLLTLAITICFVTRTSDEQSEEDDKLLANSSASGTLTEFKKMGRGGEGERGRGG